MVKKSADTQLTNSSNLVSITSRSKANGGTVDSTALMIAKSCNAESTPVNLEVSPVSLLNVHLIRQFSTVHDGGSVPKSYLSIPVLHLLQTVYATLSMVRRGHLPNHNICMN